MKLFRYLYIFTFLVCSCHGVIDEQDPSAFIQGDGFYKRVSVSLNREPVKSGSSVKEDEIFNTTVFIWQTNNDTQKTILYQRIYSESEVLDFSLYFSDQTEYTYSINAWANMGELEEEPDDSEVLFSGESVSCFQMKGSLTGIGKGTGSDLIIPMRRFVGKITVSSVSLRWNNPSNSFSDFKLIGMWMANAGGAADGSTPAYNLEGIHEPSSQDEMLYTYIDAVIPDGETYNIPHSLYAYGSGNTALILQCEWAGHVMYYNIPYEPVSNANRTFSLVIYQTGSEDPIGPVTDNIVNSTSYNAESWEESDMVYDLGEGENMFKMKFYVDQDDFDSDVKWLGYGRHSVFGEGFGISQVSKIYLDGVEVEIDYYVKLYSPGEHEVVVVMNDSFDLGNYMFSNIHGDLDFSRFDTSNLTSMLCMFREYTSYSKTLDLSNFNTSNVTDMGSMFSGCSSLQTLDLSSFDTASVTNMSRMFSECSSLQTLDLSGFNTSNVVYMFRMFGRCSSLQMLDISSFDTGNITDMTDMFSGCSSLQTLDLSNFDTASVTNMCYMFEECSSLETLDLSSFNTSKVYAMDMIFSGCTSLENVVLSQWDFRNIFESNLAKVFINSSIKFLDLSGSKILKSSDLSTMLSEISTLISLDVSYFDTSNLVNMSSMFYGLSSIVSLNLNGFDTSNVTDMSYMFSGCSGLQTLDLSSLDTSNVTDMSCMFEECSSLETLDLSNFVTNKVTDMNSLFCGCGNLQGLDLSNFDTSNVISMVCMFNSCHSLSNLDLSHFDMSLVESICEMFSDCSALNTLNLWTEGCYNVCEMGYMFSNCSDLTSVSLCGWEFEESPCMCGLFVGCSSLSDISLSLTFYDSFSANDLFSGVADSGLLRYSGEVMNGYISSFIDQLPSGWSYEEL